MTDPQQNVAKYVHEHAPELDPHDVSAFMAEHPKPDDQPGSHVHWAVQVLRQRSEREFGDGVPLDRVVGELRRHDTFSRRDPSP